MAFQVQGKIVEVYDTVQVTDRFKKREFVIEVKDGNYAEFVKFQSVQDKCNMLDGLGAGEEVNVHFNLKGRPYTKNGTTTYFTNLDAWRIEKAGGGSQAPSADAAPSQGSAGGDDMTGMSFSEAPEDELPF